jgi:threonine dehydrogenase-like Zn-dependent dehydrogenase
MKAARCYGAGDVRGEHIAESSRPGPGEVILQVKMCSLGGTDASQYKYPPGHINYQMSLSHPWRKHEYHGY